MCDTTPSTKGKLNTMQKPSLFALMCALSLSAAAQADTYTIQPAERITVLEKRLNAEKQTRNDEITLLQKAVMDQTKQIKELNWTVTRGLEAADRADSEQLKRIAKLEEAMQRTAKLAASAFTHAYLNNTRTQKEQK